LGWFGCREADHARDAGLTSGLILSDLFHPTVVIVVDPDFGDRLAELQAPIWVADTSVNRPAAQRCWRDHPGRSHDDGVTTFVVDATLQPEKWCAEILDVVDEHHGLSGSGQAAVRLIGCPPSRDLVEHFKRLGLSEIETTPDGFMARWSDRPVSRMIPRKSWHESRANCELGPNRVTRVAICPRKGIPRRE
jgi:hypothetical protein